MDTPIPTIPTLEKLNAKPSERYIRTFAGDMDTFQKGGVPGLVPLKESQPIFTEHFVEKPPTEEEPPAKIVPPQAPEPKVEEIPIPIPIPVSTPIPEPEPELELAPVAPVEVEVKSAPLETYAEDFRKRMKETQASTLTVLAAEQDVPRPVQSELQKTETNHTSLYIVASIVLLLVGGAAVYITYSQYLAKVAPVVIAPTTSSPIFVDDRAKVSGTGTALMQSIKQSVGQPLARNAVRLLSLEADANTNVFSLLTPSIPSVVLRNIDEKGSMAGVVNVSSEQSPFFILSVSTYGATFSGMLAWEPTMQNDLAILFPLYTAPVAATSTTTTTVSKTGTSANLRGGFRDEVVSNHDVRIYRDAQGKSILLYGYWNQTLLVIARDPAAFIEILRRLATAHE